MLNCRALSRGAVAPVTAAAAHAIKQDGLEAAKALLQAQFITRNADCPRHCSHQARDCSAVNARADILPIIVVKHVNNI
jgi:hypothetical protein